ncbi:MAG TPA: ATP-binding protein [Candidatus Dormibacteraeota bacterium]|nr:ATP-binding protein [Candidatus Dormibacteraeota bacterium]
MSRSGLLLKLEFESNPEMLRVVRHALGQLAETLGFSCAECRALVLAVDEALTNIIRHAYDGEAGRPIRASFHRIEVFRNGKPGKGLEIVLEDRGKKVDRRRFCGRALEEVRPGGLGLHFMNECLDAIEFRRKLGKNQLRLIKLLNMPKVEKGA